MVFSLVCSAAVYVPTLVLLISTPLPHREVFKIGEDVVTYQVEKNLDDSYVVAKDKKGFKIIMNLRCERKVLE